MKEKKKKKIKIKKKKERTDILARYLNFQKTAYFQPVFKQRVLNFSL